MAIEFEFDNCEIISGVRIIKNNAFHDVRGSIWSTYQLSQYKDLLGFDLQLTHDKYALNQKDVLRGIHGDFVSWKLITILTGRVHQVYVDNRVNSKTYRQHIALKLTAEDNISLLLPPGVGNAFYTQENGTLYNYKLFYDGEYKDFDQQFSIRWDDCGLNINWPAGPKILSERDK
jgi:dTDP-4-dehydrorhamnose 3,5-epimerase